MKNIHLVVLLVSCATLALGAWGCSPDEGTTTTGAVQTTSSAVQKTTTTEVSADVSYEEAEELMARLDAREDSDLELYRTVTGTGDQESIELPLHPNEPLLVHFTGNGEEGHYFSVMGTDYTNGYLSILVSGEAGLVDGYAPLDWYENADTFELSVSAIGPWTLEILPATDMPEIGTPGTIEGNCSYVVRILGSPSILRIKGDGGGRQFQVVMWSDAGVETVVDSKGVYDDRVKVPGTGSVVLIIMAERPWSVTTEE